MSEFPSESHQVMSQPVELISASAANIEGAAKLVLTLRLEPSENFESTNLAISAQQAWRLKEDLIRLFENSPMLQEAIQMDQIVEHQEGMDAFDRIVREGEQPQLKRVRKKFRRRPRQ